MRRTLVLLLWILAIPAIASGQTTRALDADEKFHAAPDGVVLGTIAAGTNVKSGAQRDAWREVTIEGWIWAPSVRADNRPGFGLVVSARNGENLRDAPNGERLARLGPGALLVQLEREGQWVQVQRTGWIRESAAAGKAGAPDTGAREPATPGTAPDTPRAAPAAAGSAPATRPVDVGAGSIAWAGQAGGRLFNAPAGDTLATLRPLAAVEVLERQGEWARVRVEGWIWTPALGTPADTGAVLTGIAPEVLRSNPEGFQGRVLNWEVQFITLDRAEKIRADFAEGELFILARPPGDQPGFVYIAVPEAQKARVEALTPLQRITILARVRTGRSRQMAAPVLELIELH
jgi:hypothetical protein